LPIADLKNNWQLAIENRQFSYFLCWSI